MPKFRKKPVVIEAKQYTGLVKDHVDVVVWCGGQIGYEPYGGPNGETYQFCMIPTLEGDMKASPGDWIIRGVAGEFYPCKPDIFEKTYEPAKEETSMSNLIDSNPIEPNAPETDEQREARHQLYETWTMEKKPETQASEPAEETSNLIQHARYELERAGMFDDDADYGGAAGNAVMELIETFSGQHHSGMSAPLVLGLFYKLAQFQPLTEITSDPAEWVHVADATDDEHGTRPLYQNKRRSTTFSFDGGTTWYDIEDPSRDNGARWPGWPQKDEPEVAESTPDSEIARLAREMVMSQENAKAVWGANGRRGASQEAADLVNRAGENANRAYRALRDAVIPPPDPGEAIS